MIRLIHARRHALLSRATVSVASTLEGVSGAEAIVGVTSGADGTHTAERANLVLAQGSKPTGSGGGGTLVDVSTGAIRVAVEASWACAVTILFPHPQKRIKGFL